MLRCKANLADATEPLWYRKFDSGFPSAALADWPARTATLNADPCRLQRLRSYLSCIQLPSICGWTMAPNSSSMLSRSVAPGATKARTTSSQDHLGIIHSWSRLMAVSGTNFCRRSRPEAMLQTVQHGEGSEVFGRASPNRVQDQQTAFSALGTYAPRCVVPAGCSADKGV